MTDWLLDTLVASTALLVLVLLIRGTVARHFGPSVAYWLWLLPAVRLLMPSLTEEVSAPAAPVGGTLLDFAATPVTGNAAVMASEASFNWLALGLSVWLGGAALLFIVQMIRYCSLRDEMLANAEEIAQIGDIRIIQSDRIGGPLAFGLFRRYIAVPDHFTRSFTPQERDLALAHELAHHRAGDLYANLAAFAFLCLSWFNPLAWMAWSAFRFDQEAACDARVLAGTDSGTRQHYGRALARAATSDRIPALAMAMAQNSPRNIVERLRRLMMKDTSKRRLWVGRTAIFVAAAIALPLTATVVPVFADDQVIAEGDAAKDVRHKTKIMIFKGEGGKMEKVDISGDADTPFVKTIQKDGKTIILRTSREMSDAEIEKLVAEAEMSRAQAEADRGQAEADRGQAEADRGQAEADRAYAEAMQATVIKVRRHDGKDMAWTTDGDMAASHIREIDVSDINKNCEGGRPVTTDVSGFDGKNETRTLIVMCAKGQAKLSKRAAIQGLQNARLQTEKNEDIPESTRRAVLDILDKQIERMQKQTDE